MMGLRMIIPWLVGGSNNSFLQMCTEENEGVCGPRTCTETGVYHLKWTFRMIKPSYAFPGVASHLVNMFVVPLLMGQYLTAIVLFVTGPGIAIFFEASSGERSSIWCFFSIAETAITIFSQLFYLRYQAKKDSKEKNQ